MVEIERKREREKSRVKVAGWRAEADHERLKQAKKRENILFVQIYHLSVFNKWTFLISKQRERERKGFWTPSRHLSIRLMYGIVDFRRYVVNDK